MIVLHVTDKSTAEKIKKEGYPCRDYLKKHPLGEKCTTFFYPINGVDKEIRFVPENARMMGKDVDEFATYVVCDVPPECKVGDLHLETSPDYRSNTIPLKDYEEYEFNRGRFEEPEVVCNTAVPPEKVLGLLPYSKLKDIFGSCPIEEKTECMKKKILDAVKGH
jgi:hypothetical protein